MEGRLRSDEPVRGFGAPTDADSRVVSDVAESRSKLVLAIALLVAIPVVANALALFGVLDANAQLLFSGLQMHVVPGFRAGLPYIDPSGATIYEPQAREALRQWLAGSVPWWNHYEGVGLPLAGGVVPGAFSPYLLLLLLPKGIVLQQVVGQILCGLFTFKAMRLIGCSRSAAFVAGALFEMNGTFAWLGSVWSMPMFALPLWICGIEYIRRDDRRATFLGVGCIIAATDIAIVSSFIETGFLEGLLASAWFVVRCFGNDRSGRIRLLIGAPLGAALGLMLASPVLVALLDALKYGFSTHQGGTIGYSFMPSDGIPQLFLPYIWGPINKYHAGGIDSVWANVGGYGGVGIFVLASAALAARKFRPLTVMLACWVVLTIGAEFGVPFLLTLMNLIPGVKYTAQYRYAPPTWEFALAVLCAIAITEWQRDRSLYLHSVHRIALGVLAVVLCGSIYAHSNTLIGAGTQTHYGTWLLLSVGAAVFTVVSVLACMARSAWPGSMRLMSLVVVGEAFLWYIVPTLSYPRSGSIDTRYLSAFHREGGFSRLYSVNALQPNYGSLYQVAQINYNDTIIPKNYVDYVQQLDPYNVSPILFLPYRFGPSAGLPDLADILAWHRRRFEAIGVKFVDATADQMLPSYAPPTEPGQQQVTLGPARLVGSFRGPLAGDVATGLSIPILADGSPDGAVRATLCSGSACVSGSGALTPGRSVELRLERPLPIVGGRIAFEIRQVRYHRPASMQLFLRGSSDERVLGHPDVFPQLRIRTQLQRFDVPVGDVQTPLRLGHSIVSATVPSPEVQGSIVALRLANVTNPGGDADVRVRLCASRCVTGRTMVPGKQTDTPMEIEFSAPLPMNGDDLRLTISSPVTSRMLTTTAYAEDAHFPERLSIDGRAAPGIALRLGFAVSGPLPSERYHNGDTSLFTLPSPAPYFEAPRCSINGTTRDTLAVRCDRPSVLIRRELSYPGWTASVNATAVTIRTHQALLQEISLPRGSSLVTFSYEPRFARASLFLALVAAIALLMCIAGGLWMPRRVATYA